MQPVRVAVTGVGLVTPLGWGREPTWRGLRDARSAVDWLTFPESAAGVASTPLNPAAPVAPRWFGAAATHESWGLRPSAHNMALAAARDAICQAQLDEEPRRLEQAAVVLGASKADMSWVDLAWRTPVACSPVDLWRALQPGAPAQLLAGLIGAQGQVLCPVAACASGLVAVIRGANLIQEGACSIALAGSADAALHPGLLASYRRLGVLADPGENPAGSCRPFDAERKGFAVGEGAGVLVLEDWNHAQRRGAQPLAEWIDGGLASDPTGLTTIDETGAPLAELVQRVLDRAQIRAKDVDAVQVHGTATRMNDEAEAAALRAVFRGVPRTPLGWGLKGAIGHLMGAAGSVESAACVLALHHHQWPATVNHRQPLPDCPLEFRQSTSDQRPLRTVLKLSLGFGGHLAAGVWRRAESRIE